MILYNIGDMHTCHNHGGDNPANGYYCFDIEDHYWHKIGKLYGCKHIKNDSFPGRSNEAMIKIAMTHCLQNLKLPTLYILNITTMYRFELEQPASYPLQEILKKSALKKLDFETLECTLYAQLIGLMEFFKARNKKFLIINNDKNFSSEQLPMRDAFVKYFQDEPRVLNWFDNSRTYFHENVTQIKPVDFDVFGWNGHDGVQAHSKYYEMLADTLKNRNLL